MGNRQHCRYSSFPGIWLQLLRFKKPANALERPWRSSPLGLAWSLHPDSLKTLSKKNQIPGPLNGRCGNSYRTTRK